MTGVNLKRSVAFLSNADRMGAGFDDVTMDHHEAYLFVTGFWGISCHHEAYLFCDGFF